MWAQAESQPSTIPKQQAHLTKETIIALLSESMQ